mgnify:CR=1 FL=1
MGQKEMTVNILPTRTWNRLGMNESQIQIEWPEESVLIKPERLAAGVTWEKEISGKEWDEIQTGMGREYDAMAAECGTAGANRTDTVNGTAVAEENAGAGSIYRLTAEAAAVLQSENTEWTVLCVDYKNGSYQNRLCLDAMRPLARAWPLCRSRSRPRLALWSSFRWCRYWIMALPA